jgi:hypothetical protein
MKSVSHKISYSTADWYTQDTVLTGPTTPPQPHGEETAA